MRRRMNLLPPFCPPAACLHAHGHERRWHCTTMSVPCVSCARSERNGPRVSETRLHRMTWHSHRWLSAHLRAQRQVEAERRQAVHTTRVNAREEWRAGTARARRRRHGQMVAVVVQSELEQCRGTRAEASPAFSACWYSAASRVVSTRRIAQAQCCQRAPCRRTSVGAR